MSNCKECGESYSMSHTTREEDGFCFTCSFWLGHIARRIGDDAPWRDTSVVVKHTAYHMGPDDPDAYFKGFGGHKFYVRFFDGRKATCSNMWCQGDVDWRFQSRLPNNAEFITRKEYEDE